MQTIYGSSQELLQDILIENYIPIMGMTLHSARWHGTIYQKTERGINTYLFASAYQFGDILVTKYQSKEDAINEMHKAMQYV